jgi:hypothetical protein
MIKPKILFFTFNIVILFLANGCIKDSLNVQPGDVVLSTPLNNATDVTFDATLVWQETIDPDGDILKYDVYLGTEAVPVTIVSKRQTSTQYTQTLTSGITYYWKVVALDGKDGTSESDIWSFTTLNNGAEELVLISPTNAATNITLNATLIWQEIIDPDGDVVVYDVYLDTIANPTTRVKIGQKSTSYSQTLVSGTTYYWKVVGKYSNGDMLESAIWEFRTMSPNHPPGSFNQTYPVDGAENVTHDDAILTWQASVDPDGDAVTYDVYLGTSTNPTTIVSSSQIGTSYTPTLNPSSTYYWKIVAKDGKGGTYESAVWVFYTLSSNQPPGEFNLISPLNKATNIALGTSLTWQASIDPEGDSVTYDVYFGTDPNATHVVSKNQVDTTYSPTLQKGNVYYWRVVAKDGLGGTRESTISSFTMVPAI